MMTALQSLSNNYVYHLGTIIYYLFFSFNFIQLDFPASWYAEWYTVETWTLSYYLVRLVWFRVYFTCLSLVLLRQGECVFLTLPAGGTSPGSRVVVWYLSVGALHFIWASLGIPVACEVSGDNTGSGGLITTGHWQNSQLATGYCLIPSPWGYWNAWSASWGRNSGLSVRSSMVCVWAWEHGLSAEFGCGRAVIVKKLSVFLSWF